MHIHFTILGLRSRVLCAGFLIASVLCASRTATAGTAQVVLWGNDWQTGQLYDLNPLTGAASNPRSTGIQNLVGLSWNTDDEMLYGLMAGEDSKLVRINPITGASELVGLTGQDFISEGDLDFDPTTGALWGLQDVMPFNSRELFTIDPGTGLADVIGNVNTLGDLSAMAFDDGGNLYALDTSGELLLTLSTANAQILTSVPLSQPLGAVAGMDFHPDTGVLYVVDGFTDGTDSLFTLDTDTGLLTEVGPTGLPDGLAGLEFLPEPGTLALLVFGGLPLLRRRRLV